MQSHLFLSDSGDLYDTRAVDWSRAPLRARYARHYREVKNVSEFKACLRAGAYAWPGGYPCYFITSDGGALSYAAARSEYRNIVESISSKSNDGWRIVACDVNWEDTELYCDHTNARIESAYGDNDDR